MPKIEKGSDIFKMFNEWYRLIQTYEVPKDDKELDKIKTDFEDWAMGVPSKARLFAMCLSYGFVKYIEYQMRGIDEVEVYRREDGRIMIKGKIRASN